MNVSKIAKNGLLYTQTGTPYYASPEVWMDKPYDSKSDIWSLGCVIYEMTTMKPPFRAEDMEGLYKKVVKGSYPKIPATYSQELNNVIKAMLQVNPIMRPSSDKILQSSIIVKKGEELNIDPSETASSINQLLKTIRMPKNLHYLTDRLPRPNYMRELDSVDRTNFKTPTSPDKPSTLPVHAGNLPKLESNSRSAAHRRITRDYHPPQHKPTIENPVSIQIHKLYNVKSYKNPAVLHKPSGRNISLPPIKG